MNTKNVVLMTGAAMAIATTATAADMPLFAVRPNGDLVLWNHVGADTGAVDWVGGNIVGSGWTSNGDVVGGTRGAMWIVTTGGALNWYRHTDLAGGTISWAPGSGQTIGSGFWGQQIVAAPDGVIYSIDASGTLRHYRHLSYETGGADWANDGIGQVVGTNWDAYVHVFAGSDGAMYGVTATGEVYWNQHQGRFDGTNWWTGAQLVATGWPAYEDVFAGPGGVVYAVTANGDLYWRRHDGFATGGTNWTGPTLVGTGWPIDGRVFASFPESWISAPPAPETPVDMPQFATATYQGGWPCSVGFLDVGRNECWTCPSGYNRTVYPVTGAAACEYSTGMYTSYATYHGAPWQPCWTEQTWFGPITVCSPFATQCGSGQFLDPYNGGGCYSCPWAYNRSGAHITASDACTHPGYTYQQPAAYQGPAGCPSGTFHDPRNGGECWSCPLAYDRTVLFPVDGAQACELQTGADFCTAAFDQLDGIIPTDLAAGTLPAQCALSFVRGAACLLPQMAGDLLAAELTISQPECAWAPPVVNYICDITAGEVPRFEMFAQCVNNLIEAAQNAGTITFQPQNLDAAACEAFGEAAVGAVIESKLKLPLNNRTQRIHTLFERMENSQALQAVNSANGAVEQLQAATEACMAAL